MIIIIFANCVRLKYLNKLFQPLASRNSKNLNILNFFVIVSKEDAIKMEMQIRGKVILSETLDASSLVNDGDWHRVTFELSSHEVRCGLDSERRIVTIPFHNNITFDGLLYLGGKMYR